MSHFVLLLDSYVKSIIIEQSWVILKEDFSVRAKSIDAVYDAHTAYINRITVRLILALTSDHLQSKIRSHWMRD